MPTIFRRSLPLALVGVIALAAGAARAVPDPDAIDWSASPGAFISSLYNGVLGREPESAAVVAAWAANITSDPHSRLDAFSAFLQSPEYRAGTSSQAPRTWGVFRWPQGNTVCYAASSQPDDRWFLQRRRLTEGQARALVGFYRIYASRR